MPRAACQLCLGLATAKSLRICHQMGSWEGAAHTKAPTPGARPGPVGRELGASSARAGSLRKGQCSWGRAGLRGHRPRLCEDWLAIQLEMTKREPSAIEVKCR